MDITSDSHSQHISRQFNQELEELKTHLMAMGGLVENRYKTPFTPCWKATAVWPKKCVTTTAK